MSLVVKDVTTWLWIVLDLPLLQKKKKEKRAKMAAIMTAQEALITDYADTSWTD